MYNPSRIFNFFDELDLIGLRGAGSSFPSQYSGLRTYYASSVVELCLVDEADAPSSMGGVLKIDKNGTRYAIYLVETSDPNASSVRINTLGGVKAMRLKT